jgi:uncharacterized protein (TIGR01244 family)
MLGVSPFSTGGKTMRCALGPTALLAILMTSAAVPLAAQPAAEKPPSTGAVAATVTEGFGILNATSPEPGLLFGGQPTEAQLQALAAAKYKTVIDLRAPSEDRGYDEPTAAAKAGLVYVPLPITDETLDQAETLDAFIRIFNEAEKPVLVHCAGGGRVATAYYAWLVSEKKMSREEALAKAKEQGLRSEKYLPLADDYLDQRTEKP